MNQFTSSKQKQKEKLIAQFINFTQSNEKKAVQFLSQHDWKLDLAVDAFYLSLDTSGTPRNDPTKAPTNLDKKKIDSLWDAYKGN